jgi:post-segregation antitoxin (ccd killing protein)
MVRMQVQFSEEEVTALRRAAADRQVSISAVVREAVERCVVQQEARAHAAAVQCAKAAVGRFKSKTGDASARHDDYFVEAVEG